MFWFVFKVAMVMMFLHSNRNPSSKSACYALECAVHMTILVQSPEPTEEEITGFQNLFSDLHMHILHVHLYTSYTPYLLKEEEINLRKVHNTRLELYNTIIRTYSLLSYNVKRTIKKHLASLLFLAGLGVAELCESCMVHIHLKF